MLGADDTFVVIACDGLWDVMSSQEAVEFVRARMTSPLTSSATSSLSLALIAQALVTHAIEVRDA
jgi:serine/threonine protein phosphatase PrpC